jgi:bacterial/archaeal transporter family-2 protein
LSNSIYLLLALVAGAGLAFQAVINTRLSQALGSPLWASVVQVFVGLVFLAACVTIVRQPLPVFSGAGRLPWWIWIGGAIGAAYVLSVIVTTRPLGVALMVASVVVGQSVAALLIDHYGWFGVEVHRLSPLRVAGVGLLLAGVLLIRWR